MEMALNRNLRQASRTSIELAKYCYETSGSFGMILQKCWYLFHRGAFTYRSILGGSLNAAANPITYQRHLPLAMEVALNTHIGVDLLDQMFKRRSRDLVGRGWHFCMPGHRLILRPMSKPGGALAARYTHCCICACPCSACCGFCSLLWGEY